MKNPCCCPMYFQDNLKVKEQIQYQLQISKDANAKRLID